MIMDGLVQNKYLNLCFLLMGYQCHYLKIVLHQKEEVML